MSFLLGPSSVTLLSILISLIEAQSQCLDSTPGPPPSTEACLCLQEVAQDLRMPIILEAIPDGSGRVVVGEQAGLLYVYSQEWVRHPTPFMNVSASLVLDVGEADERGFLGLTFHPQYARNGKFYGYFTPRSTTGATEFSTQLVEFTVNTTDPNRANLTSGRLLLELEQSFMNHNGGALFFGIDDYLYLFTGDGGSEGDPENKSQNKSILFGKALRIDVDSAVCGPLPYAIPPDNPFLNIPEVRPEVYAYGLRNPWRCSMDQGDRVTGYGRGRIFCGDVGQSSFEEIDIIQAGKNYGWPRLEAFECYKPPTNCGCPLPDEVLPIFAYNRSVGVSVIGGFVYRGCENPSLHGAYIMGDFGNGRLIKLEEDTSAPTGWKDTELKTCGPEVCVNGLTNSYGPNILSFGTDQHGELYMLASEEAFSQDPSGKIYKLIDPNRQGDPMDCQSRREI